MVWLLLMACGADPCRSLCAEVGRRIGGECLADWGYSWEDLGAESRQQYVDTCKAEWDTTRAALESRQIPDAEDRCDAGSEELVLLGCDELRVLYF